VSPCILTDWNPQSFGLLGLSMVFNLDLRHTHSNIAHQHTAQQNNRFGVSSFCRTGTYGMPQFVTNTIRLCTKDAANAAYDASVPVSPLYYARQNGSANSYTTSPVFEDIEHCSESPHDVPWSTEDAAQVENPAATFSVGCVPMWDGSAMDQNPVYPSSVYDSQLYNMDPGISSATSSSAWGQGCMDGKLLECAKDEDCKSIDSGTVTLSCKYVVCYVHV